VVAPARPGRSSSPARAFSNFLGSAPALREQSGKTAFSLGFFFQLASQIGVGELGRVVENLRSSTRAGRGGSGRVQIFLFALRKSLAAGDFSRGVPGADRERA
jgi:hypothetical protein